MEIMHLGLLSYEESLKKMELYHSEVVSKPEHQGYLLVVQHPPTVTMGKRELLDDMKIPPSELKFKGISYFKIDRGGSVTVHEPGQIVIYPILRLDLYKLTVRSFVCSLEQAMIDTCAVFGVDAKRDKENPGVWIGENKVGALGIRILNKVSKHGIAFNVTNSLETFSNIIPCGIRGKGVTNLKLSLADFKYNIEDDIFYSQVENILLNKLILLLNK